MRVLCFKALRRFEHDGLPANLAIGVDRNGVQGARGEARIVCCRFEDEMRFNDFVVDYVDGV